MVADDPPRRTSLKIKSVVCRSRCTSRCCLLAPAVVDVNATAADVIVASIPDAFFRIIVAEDSTDADRSAVRSGCQPILQGWNKQQASLHNRVGRAVSLTKCRAMNGQAEANFADGALMRWCGLWCGVCRLAPGILCCDAHLLLIVHCLGWKQMPLLWTNRGKHV